VNVNLKRYWNSTSIEEFVKRSRKFPKGKVGTRLFRLNVKFRSWLICGFHYIKNENVKGGRTWNDNYHLLSKLYRYESWNNVKITWWDKIRFKIITGYKFEEEA
jgi:hypothetical protein